MTKTLAMIKTLPICLAIAISILPGCVSDGTNTRFYVIGPIAHETVLTDEGRGKNDISIEIVSLSLPQYLERPQIVTRNSSNELYLAEFHQWGGNLRQDMTRVLAKNLSQLLNTADVSISRRSPRNPADFRIQAEVLKFERDPDGKVRLMARWLLMSGMDQGIIVTRISDIESKETVPDGDYGRIVSAMGDLMGEFSLLIGKEILNHVQ